uniref:Uncharacterized protein n=1 Tax=Setaria digitata TaxID=48799 RepID=A0A915PRY5_9BILA
MKDRGNCGRMVDPDVCIGVRVPAVKIGLIAPTRTETNPLFQVGWTGIDELSVTETRYLRAKTSAKAERPGSY